MVDHLLEQASLPERTQKDFNELNVLIKETKILLANYQLFLAN